MLPSLVTVSLVAALTLPAATVRNRTCTGGMEAARIRMDVRPADKNDPRSLSRIKRIPKGTRILYKPIELPADIKKDAKVTLVLRSAEQNTDTLTVLDFKPAAMPVEWVMPFRPSLVILALGPQGLDEKRVNNLVKDDELLASLADYADQTNEIEATIELLATEAELEQAADDAAATAEDLSAEVRLSRGNSTEQALGALLRAVNSSFITGNPFGAGRRMGPVTMANKATAGFFDNAGAMFPGGGALSEIRPFLFPDTEFRAAFVQHTGENLSLCVPRTAARSRNRQVYLWARNIIDSPAPVLKLASNGRLAIGTRAVIALRAGKTADWDVLDQADRWTLQPVSGGGGDPVPIRVRTAPQSRALELDLRGFPGGPGKYRLRADWDWDTATVAGDLELAPLADLRQAKIAPETSLVEGHGPSVVTVEGTDFEFIERVSLRRSGTDREFAENLPFSLPKGKRAGVQEALEVDVNTTRLRSGSYVLALAQADGKTRELPVEVDPPDAEVRIEGLPLRIASNPGPQRLLLRGVGLEKIRQIEATGLEVKLDPPAPQGKAERGIVVEVRNGAAPRTRIDLALQVEGSSRKRKVTEAIEVVGLRPRMTAMRTSVPEGLGTALRQDELPVGSFVSFALTTDGPIAAVRLECERFVRTVRAGARDQDSSLSATGANTWFLSVDPSVFGNSGCQAKGRIESLDGLESDPFDLGKPVRLPRIDAIAFSGEQLADGTYAAVLTGQDLELIERTGWAGGNGSPVTALPSPMVGEARKQSLRIAMPWPSPAPKAVVHVWLRGETEPRTTTVRY